MFSLAGKTAVVTGASSGLGARFASVLASAGATVFAAARRADRLAALGSGITPVTCDVSVAVDRERLIETAGRVDILVNNAGVPGEQQAAKEQERK